MKAILSVAGLLAIAAVPALAAANEGFIGGGFGGTIPVNDVLKEEADKSWAADGFGVWRVSGPLHLRVSSAYDRFRPSAEDREACAEIHAKCMSRIGRIDGGVELAPRGDVKVKPFGFAEIGAYNLKSEVAVGGMKTSESKTFLGGGFGGGVRAHVGHNWGVGAELPVRWWREKEDSEKKTYWYLEPNGFVYLRFGRR